MDPGSLSRKERERLRHKEEIVAGAKKLFAEKGFHNVSMQEIAETTEFATGTLYNFFPSKEALYAEMILDCSRKIMDFLVPILESPETEDQIIRRFIQAHQQLFVQHKEVVRLYLAEVNRLSMVLAPSLDQTIERMRLDIQDRLTALIQSGVERKIFRPCHAVSVAVALSGMLESMAFSAVSYPQLISMDHGLPAIESLFFNGMGWGGHEHVQ